MDESLAKRLSVDQLVGVYEQAERDVREGFALVARAEKALGDTLVLGSWRSLKVRARHNAQIDFDDTTEVLRELRRQVWETLVERLELRRFMSIAEWEKLECSLRDEKEVPAIDRETVAGMARSYYERMPEMIETAIREVHDWLRPRENSRGAEYKTNDVVEVGRKVVVPNVFDRGDWMPRWYLNSHADARLTALENVFSSLDGRGQVTAGHYSEVSTIVRGIERSQPCVGQTRYFRFKGYGNGNMHIEFRRTDLLARFNSVAGGARLRPAPSSAA